MIHSCASNRYFMIARKLVNYFPSKSLIRLSSRLLAFIWGAKQPEWIYSFQVIFNLVSVCYGFSTGNRYFVIARKLVNFFPFKSLIHLLSRLLAFIWGTKQPERISSFRVIFNLVLETVTVLCSATVSCFSSAVPLKRVHYVCLIGSLVTHHQLSMTPYPWSSKEDQSATSNLQSPLSDLQSPISTIDLQSPISCFGNGT